MADETVELVWKVVAGARKPMLIDADGLNALARKPSVLLRRKCQQVIVTPHAGELARLLGVSSHEVEGDRLALAAMFARKFRLTLVSKGAPSLTAARSGNVYVNSSGNPGLATAGAGDVLAGVIAGLWGQKMTEEAAAYAGIYLHGLAGDLAAAEYGIKGMVAMDICGMLPKAFRTVEEGR